MYNFKYSGPKNHPGKGRDRYLLTLDDAEIKVDSEKD